MKTLELRTLPEEPVITSWSPKTDLLAIVCNTGQIAVHRLTWQQLWKISSLKEGKGTPNCLAWHPEGHYICLVIKNVIVIVEVETGRLISKYQVGEDVVWAKWCGSEYETVLDAKESSDESTKSGHPLETNISVLLLGSACGQVSAYIGGVVLGLRFKVPCSVPITILSGDASQDLQCFEFISQPAVCNEKEGSFILFNHFRSSLLPTLMDTIGHLGHKYTSLKNTWGQIQDRLQTFADQWKKIHTTYVRYLIFEDNGIETDLRGDYYELVLSGISSPEIDSLLARNIGEKETKRNIGLVTSNWKSMCDLVAPMKSAFIQCLHDLQSITQFMELVGPVEAQSTCHDLQKLFKYLEYKFYFVWQAHIYAQKFIDGFLAFLAFFTHKTRALNSPDTLDTMTTEEVDKILVFLETELERDIYEFFLMCHSKKRDTTETSFPNGQIDKMLASMVLSGKHQVRTTTLETTTEQLLQKNLGTYISSNSQNGSCGDNGGSGDHNLRSEKWPWDWDMEEMRSVFQNTPAVGSQIEQIQKIPLVDPRFIYNQYGLAHPGGPARNKPISYNLFINPSTYKTNVFLQFDTEKIYLYEFDFTNYQNNIKSSTVTFSRDISFTSFYSDEFLTLIGYDESEKKEGQQFGTTLVCQFSVNSIISRAASKQIGFSIVKESSHYVPISTPSESDTVKVEIPSDLVDEALENEFIKCVLPIEDFRPCSPAINGARKIGSVLNSTKKVLQLLDFGEDDEEEVEEEDEPMEG